MECAKYLKEVLIALDFAPGGIFVEAGPFVGFGAAFAFALPGGTWRLGVGFTFLYDYNSVVPNPEQSE